MPRIPHEWTLILCSAILSAKSSAQELSTVCSWKFPSLIDLLQVICYYIAQCRIDFSLPAFVGEFFFSIFCWSGKVELKLLHSLAIQKITHPVHTKNRLEILFESTRREHQIETDTKDFF